MISRPGSPPRVRGKVAERRHGYLFHGDHPRVCGEKQILKIIAKGQQGSPPRVRGKDASTGLADIVVGITPACAGKSRASTSSSRTAGDHPRVCGEKILEARHSPIRTGSPPRVRGKAGRCRCDRRGNGITPACAGKSQPHYRFRQCPRDHPRVCGEKTSARILLITSAGSPPRVRGKVSSRLFKMPLTRITPACAGKSEFDFSRQRWEQDHPRVCGEKGNTVNKIVHTVGSPPRVRGKALLMV